MAADDAEWFPPTRPEAAVFVSGVASMGLEILAGRMIAPQFGSSIYTWGTIIGVFLAALSYGYHRGGRAAAEAASLDRLARLFVWTGLYVAALVVAGDVVLRSTVALPLPGRFASLPAVVILFGPPTYLLGFVSPYAAELSRRSDVGAAAGHVYAVGTVGSIVGAFATTFVLVPALSVTTIAVGFGLVSAATAVGLVGPRSNRDRAVAGVGVAVVLVAAAAVSGLGVGASVGGRVVHAEQTAYQELRVVDRGEVRTLYLDGQRHSAMDRSDPTRHVFDYTAYFHVPLLFGDDADPERVLFVGGGGFTGPKRFLEDTNATVDVVEIDPAVVRVARDYFAVPDSERLNVHVEDGRRFLRDTNRTYDVIILDAYRKDKVPFQLTTVEFFELASDRLTDDGVLLANVISAETGPASQFYRAEYRTMQRVFPNVYAFPTTGGSVVQNVEVVASKEDRRYTREALRARAERRDVGLDLSSELATHRRDPPTDDVPVLRDDRAPVDDLLDPMVGRRYVVQETNATPPASTGASPARLAA
jgi:spermidine synthase